MAEEPDGDWTPVVLQEEPKGARKKTSTVWQFCEQIDNTFAICTLCNHKLSYRSSVTNLRKHFKKKHPEVTMSPNPNYQSSSVKKRTLCTSDDERDETQRATNTVIVDYLRPAGDENRSSKYSRNNTSFAKYAAAVKRERSPERSDCRLSKYSRLDETEFELFGRSIVMQLKQLPLVHALEVQAEITNLICQKRIQALRQSHHTNTEEVPMQYALVYATTEPTTDENVDEISVEKVSSVEESIPIASTSS